MKCIATNKKIKNKARTLAEFKNIVKELHLKEEASVTLRDRKRNVLTENMRLGSFLDACELCKNSEIVLVSYKAIYAELPKQARLRTRVEYEKEEWTWRDI